MSTLQIETVASLQPHSIVLYKAFPSSSREAPVEASLLNLDKGTAGLYNGYMSPATARKVRKLLSCWLLALDENRKSRKEQGVKYYPTFVTLTLASKQQHDDNHIKRNMLNRFILRVQKLFGVKYYFWRAEPQENGNIHFHLLIDRWAKWETLRAEWNKIQKEHGYLDAYRLAQEAKHSGGFMLDSRSKATPAAQLKAFAEGVACGWSNPNSTDIHKIDKLDSITAYVVKYMCKGPDSAATEEAPAAEATGSRRKIKGRIWGCSDELRELGYYADTHSIEANYQSQGNPEIIDYVAEVEAEVGQGAVYEDDFIKVIRLKHPQSHYLKKYSPALSKSYSSHYRNIYKRLYEEPKKEPLFEVVKAIIPEPELPKPKIVQGIIFGPRF